MNTYIFLAIASIIIALACKGIPIMKDTIKKDNGEYEIKTKKQKQEQNKDQPTRTAAEILRQKYEEDEKRTERIQDIGRKK